MRGKVASTVLWMPFSGITPAYAGKSADLLAEIDKSRDHPRLCGEKLLPFEMESVLTGSPPPMRGKGSPSNKLLDIIGITPAYAGKRFGAEML